MQVGINQRLNFIQCAPWKSQSSVTMVSSGVKNNGKPANSRETLCDFHVTLLLVSHNWLFRRNQTNRLVCCLCNFSINQVHKVQLNLDPKNSFKSTLFVFCCISFSFFEQEHHKCYLSESSYKQKARLKPQIILLLKFIYFFLNCDLLKCNALKYFDIRSFWLWIHKIKSNVQMIWIIWCFDSDESQIN